MKYLLLSLLLSLPAAYAGDGHEHTPDYCSLQSPEVCAHLGIPQKITTQKEGVFVAHIMTPNEQNIQNLSIDLWMPSMNHGTAPVQIKELGDNHFRVNNAWFVMTGEWHVRLKFTFNNKSEEISIPLDIKE